jgi:4-hydroxy-tetrahydrodipicolinate synthase
MVEMAAGRGAVIAGVGAEGVAEAASLAREAEQAGCDAIMAAPPVAMQTSADDLKAYFVTLADEVGLPLIVQDASGYVGQPIPLRLYAELLDRFGPAKVMFKPEAPPVGLNLSALRDLTGGRARIFEGSGGIFLVDTFRRGIVGTMPGVDLLDGIVALWRALQAGDEEATYRLYLPICAIVALQMQAGLDGFLAIEKYIMVKRGLFTSDRRRPPYAWSLDDETAREIDRLLARLSAYGATTLPCQDPSADS